MSPALSKDNQDNPHCIDPALLALPHAISQATARAEAMSRSAYSTILPYSGRQSGSVSHTEYSIANTTGDSHSNAQGNNNLNALVEPAIHASYSPSFPTQVAMPYHGTGDVQRDVSDFSWGSVMLPAVAQGPPRHRMLRSHQGLREGRFRSAVGPHTNAVTGGPPTYASRPCDTGTGISEQAASVYPFAARANADEVQRQWVSAGRPVEATMSGPADGLSNPFTYAPKRKVPSWQRDENDEEESAASGRGDKWDGPKGLGIDKGRLRGEDPRQYPIHQASPRESQVWQQSRSQDTMLDSFRQHGFQEPMYDQPYLNHQAVGQADRLDRNLRIHEVRRDSGPMDVDPRFAPAAMHGESSSPRNAVQDHFGVGGLGLQSFGHGGTGAPDEPSAIQTPEDMSLPWVCDVQDMDWTTGAHGALLNPSNGQFMPSAGPSTLVSGQAPPVLFAPHPPFNGPTAPIPPPQPHPHQNHGQQQPHANQSQQGQQQQGGQNQVQRVMTRQTALANPRNRIAAWNLGFRIGEAPQENARMPGVIGAVEMLMLLPNHTKRPMALLRLLGNGWKAKQIGAVQQFARGGWMPTPNNDPVERRGNAIRQQKSWTRALGAATPVANYSTAGYAQRTAATTEEDVTLASIAQNIVHWPAPMDGGVFTQAVWWAMNSGDTTSKVSDIPTLAVINNFAYPIDLVTGVSVDNNPNWDMEGRARIVAAMKLAGVSI
ncbi:hypothetical protein LTR53_000525 [Teratosphaeriaceae sp. CCFEE 6253]|nr:hypothetical protein LTR53_000525 [Teratosphaeriaceae sp. CCFEE 6253]